MSAAERCPENDYLAEKRSFEGTCNISRTLLAKDIISRNTSRPESGLIIL